VGRGGDFHLAVPGECVYEYSEWSQETSACYSWRNKKKITRGSSKDITKKDRAEEMAGTEDEKKQKKSV
jgi:hypothetical protein